MPELVIVHSGVKERSGRYKWGSGDRPYQRLEKARGRFGKIDAKRQKAQTRADKAFERAQKKANSIFSNQKSSTKAFEKAVEAQRVADRLEYKGSVYYQKIVKKIESGKIKGNYSDLEKLGNKYMEMVRQNSKTIYNLAIVTQQTPSHISKGNY